jgi:hypothetical protein
LNCLQSAARYQQIFKQCILIEVNFWMLDSVSLAPSDDS